MYNISCQLSASDEMWTADLWVVQGLEIKMLFPLK